MPLSLGAAAPVAFSPAVAFDMSIVRFCNNAIRCRTALLTLSINGFSRIFLVALSIFAAGTFQVVDNQSDMWYATRFVIGTCAIHSLHRLSPI
jgi:hypothetical protein